MAYLRFSSKILIKFIFGSKRSSSNSSCTRIKIKDYDDKDGEVHLRLHGVFSAADQRFTGGGGKGALPVAVQRPTGGGFGVIPEAEVALVR